MRIESVTAHAFGPLVDQTLTLAPGLTVITGVNESAKSSWHAALHAALVGRRRGKGAPTREERHFAELHKPWDGTEWRVSAILTLDDGRRVELTHELDGKVDCRATDLAMGVDISNEIMFEGAPDASRFLGLDRRSFAATAVVNQADMLSVLAAADGLQEHLQRAAATAGTDATAAAALAAIDRFSRDNVGLDRSNSTKPLRASRDALVAAEAELAAARNAHEHYQVLVADADLQRAAADEATTRTREAELAVAALQGVVEAARVVTKCQVEADRTGAAAAEVAARADALSKRVTRAQVLAAGGADESGVPSAASTESTARAVATALASWAAAPAHRVVDGPTAAELRLQIDCLPSDPDGDTAVAPEVRAAADSYAQAQAVAAAHQERRTPDPGEPNADLAAAVSAGPAVVRELAAQLSAARSSGASGLADVEAAWNAACEAHDKAAEEVAQSEASELSARNAHAAATAIGSPSAPNLWAGASTTRRVLLVLGLLGAATAAVALVAGAPVLSAAAGTLGVLSLIGAALAPARHATVTTKPGQDAEALAAAVRAAAENVKAAQSRMYATMRSKAEAEARLAAAQTASSAADDVAARCATRSLPADVSALHTLAAQAEQHMDARRAFTEWAELNTSYVDAVARTRSRLLAVLAERGRGQIGDDAEASLAAYEEACAQRADQHARAARRTELERALATREIADAEAEDADRRRTDAYRGLLEAARQTGAEAGPDTDPAQLVTSLERWQAEYGELLTAAEARTASAAQLEALLDGSSLADLERDLAQLRQEGERLGQLAEQAERRVEEAKETAADAALAAGMAEAVTDADSAAKYLAVAEDDAGQARAEELALARAAENAAGIATERGRSLASVAEAEEAVDAARSYVNRVQELAETLELTASFLASAQTEVHRNIAPLLTGTLRAWLPRVTAGRYTDATVNPATLEVSVCGPQRRWRHADRLSIGTAEQVYLLLRVALAQHLTTTAESCPLLLDDVTVQADPERTEEILDLLLELAADRQIVLFAQEPAVAEWASEHLSGTDRHSALEVARVTVE